MNNNKQTAVTGEGIAPRVYVNGQTFELLEESNGILTIRRPNGSKRYQARRLGNEALYGANRAQIITEKGAR